MYDDYSVHASLRGLTNSHRKCDANGFAGLNTFRLWFRCFFFFKSNNTMQLLCTWCFQNHCYTSVVWHLWHFLECPTCLSVFAINGPKIKRTVSEEAECQRRRPRKVLGVGGWGGLFWEGAGQATRIMQAYDRPTGCAVPLQGCLFSCLRI